MAAGSSLFLTSGKVASPQSAWQAEGRDLALRGGGLARRLAIVGAATPAFRLNSPGWLAPPPELIASLPDRNSLRNLCREGLLASTSAFSAAARRAIERYLARIGEIAGAPPGTEARLEDISDRFFAALLPLPAPQLARIDKTVEDLAIMDDVVRGDLAFWDGVRVTIILFGDESRLMPRHRRALEDLCETEDIEVAVHWAAAATEAAIDAVVPESILTACLDAAPPWFGPYRAAALHEPLPDGAKE